MPSRRLPTASPSLPSHHHVDIAAAALRANQAPLPFRHWCPWRTPAGLLAGVKLNSVFLCVTPDHTPRRRCQGHWRRRLTADRRSFSTPLPVPLIKRVTERSRRQNASKCHQQGNDKRCSQDHRVYHDGVLFLHLLQPRRLPPAGTVVSGPYQRACSAGSGSLLGAWRAFG